MHAQLAASGLACVRVQIQVRCDNGEEISRLWRHDGCCPSWRWPSGCAGSSTAGGLAARPVRTVRLARPGDEGIQAGGISLRRLVRSAGRQPGQAAWPVGDAVVTDRVARAAIRVQAMLGDHAVSQPVVAAAAARATRQRSSRSETRPLSESGLLLALARADSAAGPDRLIRSPGRRRSLTAGSLVGVTGRDRRPVSLPGCRSPVAGCSPSPPDRAEAGHRALVGIPSTPAGRPGPAGHRDGGAWLAIVQDGSSLIEASYD